jgi:cobalt-zinc-cadmium efflux system protein
MAHDHSHHAHDHSQHSPHDHSQHSHSHHDHSHHAHGHHHVTPSKIGRTFAIAVFLNLIYVGVELGYGFITHSTALIADAGHNVSDVLGLILSWTAIVLARKKPNERYTYGLRSTSILAALINAMLLLIACGAIAWEAIHRLNSPPEVAGLTISAVAGIGIVVNGLSALLLMKGSQHDVNIRSAYLHMAADAAVSLSVVIAGLAMLYGQWYWLDPAMSLVIVVVIVLGTGSLLLEAIKLALSAVPKHIDTTAINHYLNHLVGVKEIHDLHIWGLSTTENALTVHLVMPEGFPGDAFLDKVVLTLKEHYNIHHSTLQVELGQTEHHCALVSH